MSISGAERLNFSQIASWWAQEPETYPCQGRLPRHFANVSEGLAVKAVLEELVASTWRGEIKRSGKSALTIPWSEGLRIHGDQILHLAAIGRQPPKRLRNPETGKIEVVEVQILAPAASLPLTEITRGDLREGLRQSSWCPSDIANAKFEVLANLPIDFYSPSFRETCLECILITRDVFRQWCERRKFALPAFWFGSEPQLKPKPGSERTPEIPSPALVMAEEECPEPAPESPQQEATAAPEPRAPNPEPPPPEAKPEGLTVITETEKHRRAGRPSLRPEIVAAYRTLVAKGGVNFDNPKNICYDSIRQIVRKNEKKPNLEKGLRDEAIRTAITKLFDADKASKKTIP